MENLQKGQFVVEPDLAVSEFVEKINKLSYENFPEDKILKVLQNHDLTAEHLEPYTFFSDARYTRNMIHKAKDFELILMCWNNDQHSAIHGHEGQKCWFKVLDGEMQITEYQEEPPSSSSLLTKINVIQAKRDYIDGPAGIHKVENVSGKPSMSLHLYALPFDKCDIYDLNTNQKMKISLGYHSVRGKLVAPEETR